MINFFVLSITTSSHSLRIVPRPNTSEMKKKDLPATSQKSKYYFSRVLFAQTWNVAIDSLSLPPLFESDGPLISLIFHLDDDDGSLLCMHDCYVVPAELDSSS